MFAASSIDPLELPVELMGKTVADVMIHHPKTLPATCLVSEVREVFLDEHVHAVLLMEDELLAGTLDRDDVAGSPADAPALSYALLAGRTIAPTAPVEAAWRQLLTTGRRRLAVVDQRDHVLGLLCLKRRMTGFCSDDDTMQRSGSGPDR